LDKKLACLEPVPNKQFQISGWHSCRDQHRTGCDDVYFKLHELRIRFGQRLDAVRGKDVSRGTTTRIWAPHPPEIDTTRFEKAVPKELVDRLRERSCVRLGGKAVYAYHDSIPDWFHVGPKLLVPEIVTNQLRVEFDREGMKFPLHSAIAIKVPSIRKGLALQRHLLSSAVQTRLFREAPRLNSGAIRIQTRLLREIPVPKKLADSWGWRKSTRSR
jgi:hypothetical protein